MKENLKAILESLRKEQIGFETEKLNLWKQGNVLKNQRQIAARNYVRRCLLPNLDDGTFKSLKLAVPGFNVPMVSKWFGLSQKLDPNVSIDTLRIQLGTYLDNSLAVTAPAGWLNSVGRLDAAYRNLLDNEIRINENRIAKVKARIQAIEKLSSANLRKMDPKLQRKLERALAAQAKPSPTKPQSESGSGPSLLEMWLWYQLLTPGSEISHGIDHFVGGGGSEGGAGASGGWRENESEPAQSVDATIGASANASTENIVTQMTLGAGSFS